MDRFTETTKIGYLKNIGNSFKGIIVGFIFVIISIILLWWNEGRSVQQRDALNEMQEEIVTLTNTKYYPQNHNKVVLIQGEVTPNETLIDPIFGIKKPFLVLVRDVKMYQWEEKKTTNTQEELGGSTTTTTTYDYIKKWSSVNINSSSFKYPTNHQNPPMAYKSESFVTSAKIGEYSLDKNVVTLFSAKNSLNDLSSLDKNIKDVVNYNSFLYKGENPNNPQIGDIKIKYFYADSGKYSIAGKAYNENIISYTTKNGKNLIFVRNGIVSSDIIFQEEHKANNILTWVLRGVGLLIMFIGFNLILQPLATIANVVPIIGSFIGAGTALISGAITIILGFFIIALAWFVARPILSIILIIIGIVIGSLLLKKSKKEENKIKEENNGK